MSCLLVIGIQSRFLSVSLSCSEKNKLAAHMIKRGIKSKKPLSSLAKLVIPAKSESVLPATRAEPKIGNTKAASIP